MSPLIILFGASDQLVSDFLDALKVELKTAELLIVNWRGVTDDVRTPIADSSLIILLFSNSQETLPPDELSQLFMPMMDKCSTERKRLVHVVAKSSSEPTWRERHAMSKRVQRMFKFHVLHASSIDAVVSDIRKFMDNDRFSSSGESFAWQLAVGFLSYILPDFYGCVKSTLLDEQDLIRDEILRDFGITGVQPKQVLVLPKYFVLLSDQVVRGEVSIAMTPPELFPGCRKICKATSPGSAPSELCLEFDSPVYKKRVPAYLIELQKPITTDKSIFTHAMIFCGYAAPLYVMQKLDRTEDEKIDIFHQFSDELEFILKHPKSHDMLCAVSDTELTKGARLPLPCCVINVNDQSSVESEILKRIEEHSQSINQSLDLSPPADGAIADDLLLMSMAFAMAANCWFGFGQILLSYIQDLRTMDALPPFDLPYCFVVPKSSRYPDESKLFKRFAELGVTQEQHQFQVSNGRRYTFRRHTWKSMRIAFEIPPSVLGIRKQAECGIGGVRPGDLGAHLAEFREELAKFASLSDGCFRVVEWDDVTGFCDDACDEPTANLAVSLLRCLETSLQSS